MTTMTMMTTMIFSTSKLVDAGPDSTEVLPTGATANIPMPKAKLRLKHLRRCLKFFSANKWGVSKNRGKTPKMDGENHGKPYFLMEDLGENPPIFRKHPNNTLFGVGVVYFWPAEKSLP